MKNLKKVLSLVLALAMAASLMTFAFAADAGDFKDYNEVSHKEAVDVMSAVGVFNGVGDGTNFDPDGTLTREQAAKIITYMIAGQTEADKLVATIAPYSDVSATRWSAGSIAYCTSEGIIAGTGDGTFNPTGELTGLAFAKMLLTALGYDAEIEQLTGPSWAINTAKLAVTAGLTKGLDISLTDPMTREEAAQMALNAEKAIMVEYGTMIGVNVGDANVTIAGSKASPVVNTATTETIETDNYMQFAEQYAQQQRSGHDDEVGRDGRKADGHDLLERELEAIEDYAGAQDLFGAELDARHPCLGQLVAQAVGVEHSQDDADNQRAERELLHEVEFCDVEGGK